MTPIFKAIAILYLLISSTISQEINSKQFVDAFVDNTEPFVNEQVTYTFRYYHQNILPTLEQPKYFPPSFRGFRTVKLASSDTKLQVVDGVTYRVEEVQTALFPISAGSHEIEPSYFYIPAFSKHFDQPKTLTTRSIRLSIKPLPERGKPVNFTGAVGKYQIRAKTNKTAVSVGQTVTLEIILSGTGDIETCARPNIPETESFKKYKPAEKISIYNEPPKLKGEILWEYVLVAQKAGDYTIPSIQYSYFNPENVAYELTQTQPISIVIKPELDKLTSKNEVTVRERQQDIQRTKSSTKLTEESDHFYQDVYFWIIVILVFLVILGTVIFKKSARQLKNSSDYVQKNATKLAEKRLKSLENSIRTKDSEQIFTELAKTLRKYLSAKLNIPQIELKAESIPNLMTEAGYPRQIGKKIAEVLEQSDRARFAPVFVNSKEMKEAVQSAREAIKIIAD